jgi:hypothetical protein
MPGLTDRQLHEVARDWVAAIEQAKRDDFVNGVPGDDWLDAKLRECGCPEGELAAAREQVKDVRLWDLRDGGPWDRHGDEERADV